MLKKTGKKIVGWFFIVLGVIGLFLPFLQGILFIAIGMGLLAGDSETIRTYMHRWKTNYPRWFPRSLEGFIGRRKQDI